MSKIEDYGSKLNFFIWDSFPSPILNKFTKYDNEAKFFSGPDRIFILAEKKFYMLTNIEIFSKNYNPKAEFKNIPILHETLGIFYPKDSQAVILHGVNELDRKKYIVIYDFIQDLTIGTIFLGNDISSQNLLIQANTNHDHSISHIALANKDHLFIYKGPFANREMCPPQIIDINNYSILLFQFGKIKFADSNSSLTMRDALYIITKEDKKLRIYLIDNNDYLTETQTQFEFFEKDDFDFSPLNCALLNNDTICFEGLYEEHPTLIVTQFKVDKNSQTPLINTFHSYLKFSLPDEITLLLGFNHYILTIDKNNILCIYDYKFIRDLTKEDLKTQKNINEREISNEEIICALKIQCRFHPKYIFYHMSKVFLQKANKGNITLSVLFEDKPSNIISKLVSSNKYFEYAKQQAKLLSMPYSEIADIEWKQANYIFNNPEIDEMTRTERAMDHFIETIGYKESSYVIQLYLNYKDETLVRYLWGNEENPSEKSLIMNPTTSCLEYRKLLISICVKLYLKNKVKLTINESEPFLPKLILEYIKDPDNEQFEDCRDSLIDAYLAMGCTKDAIDLAIKTKNYERALKLLFDTQTKDNQTKYIQTQDKDSFSQIIEILFKEDIEDELKMKYLTEYARELFYRVRDEETINGFIIKIANFTHLLILKQNTPYIQEVCLLFVPQLSSVVFELEDNLQNSQEDFVNEIKRMSNLYLDFYQEMIELNGLEKWPPIINDIYIQHLIILCRIEYFYKADSNKFLFDSNDEEDIFYKIREALKADNYTIDIAFLTIIDLRVESYKFELLKIVCCTHKEYASNFIHLVSIFKNISDDNISSAICKICSSFGKENPNLFLEAIAEFIQQERCIDKITELLESSKNIIPLPDIITYILELDQSLEIRKLNIGLIKDYVVDWMKSMLDYEQHLKDQVQKYDQELQEIPNTQYSLKEMKDIRDEYKKMVESSAKQPLDSGLNDQLIPNIKFKRPFSLIPNYNAKNILSSSSIQKDESNSAETLRNGTTMPAALLTELESGVLVDGLNNDDPKSKQHFTAEADKMITDFDKMFEILNQ